MKNVENERNQSRGETGEKHSQDTTSLEPTIEQSAEKTTVANTAGNVGISDKVTDGKENKSLPQSDGKKSKSKKGGKRDKGDRQRVRQDVKQLDKEDRNKSVFESGNKITKSEKESKYEKSQGIQGDKQQASSSSERYSEQQNTGQIPSARRKQEKPKEGPADSKTLTSKNVQKRKLLDTNTTSHANNERTKPRASGEKFKAETVKGRAEKQLAMGSRIENLKQQRATGLGDRVSSQKKAKSPPGKAARGRDLPMKLEKPMKSSRSDSASPGSEVIDKVKGDHHKEFLSPQQSLNKVSLTSKRSDSDASVGNLASANDYSKGISNTCISEFDDSIKRSSYSALSSRSDENSQYVGVHTVDSENMHSSQRSTSQPGLHDGSLQKHESQESKSSSTSEKDLSEIVTRTSPSNSDHSLSSKLESNKNIYSSSTNTGSSSTITSSTSTSSTNSSTSSTSSSTDSRTGSTNSSSTNTNTMSSSSSVSNSGSNDGSTKLKSGSNTSSTSNGSKSSSASSFTTCFTSSHNSVSNRDESSSSQESDINKHSSGTASTHSTESFASGISSSQQSSTIASISEDEEVDDEQDDSHDSEESPSEVDNEQDDSHDSEESPSEQTSESQESSNEEESHANDHSSVDSSDSTSISGDSQSHSSTTSDKESSQSSSNTVSESQSLSSLDS